MLKHKYAIVWFPLDTLHQFFKNVVCFQNTNFQSVLSFHSKNHLSSHTVAEIDRISFPDDCQVMWDTLFPLEYSYKQAKKSRETYSFKI